MVRQGWGRIICNASVTGGFYSGEMVHYGATKAALLALSRGIAESFAGSGVTVNAFLPGPTRTENVEAAFEDVLRSSGQTFETMERELFHSKLPTSLIQRFATPTEVANSEQASTITGAALRVDGGIVRSLY